MNKTIAIILGLSLFLGMLLPLALAQDEVPTFLPSEAPKEAFPTEKVQVELIPELQSIQDALSPFLRQLSIFVGGIFGLYFILMIARVYYERKSVKILKDIRYDLDRLNMHYGLSHSYHNKGWFRRMIGLFRRRSYDKEVSKAYEDKESSNRESKSKK